MPVTLKEYQTNRQEHEQQPKESILSEKVPEYILSNTQFFENLLQQIHTINDGDQTVTLTNLHIIAQLLYQQKKNDLEKSLWLTYFKAGIGLLKSEEADVKYWPINVQSLINANEKDDATACVNLVQAHLDQLEQQQIQCQKFLDENIVSIPLYKTLIEPNLEQFFQKYFQVLHMENEYKITLIGYEYQEFCLALKLQQQELQNEQQENLIEKLYNQKYEEGKSRQELSVLKHYLKLKRFPLSIATIQIQAPIFIRTIQDTNIRQDLFERHQQIIHNFKNDMMHLLLQMHEKYLVDKQKQFDISMDQFRQEQFNSTIVNLIEENLKNIEEKWETISQYKTGRLSNDSSHA